MFPCATTCEMSLDLSELLDEFKDVSPGDLPAKLTHLRDTQHSIDLVPRSPFHNFPYNGINPSECEELNRQIEGLPQKGSIPVSYTHLTLPTKRIV